MKLTSILLILILPHTILGAHVNDSLKYKTTFVISELPKSTPHDASLFIATSISGWYPDIHQQQIRFNDEGQYAITISHRADTFEYKFTRGSWESVEGRQNGRARPNRIHLQTTAHDTVLVEIDSWEDISIGSYNIYMFVLFISAFQGILLIIAINTIRNKNKGANRTLSILLALITLSLLGRASTFNPEVFNWQPKLLLVPELLLFTYGPIFYFYVHQLLVISFNRKFIPVFVLPVLIQIACYFPYLWINNQTFIYRVMDQELFSYFAISGLIALLYNSGYWIISRRLILTYGHQESLSENQRKYLRFLHWVLKIKAIYLVIWLGLTLIYLLGRATGNDWLAISENMIDVLWLLFSFLIFALAFYAVKYPEVLREKRKYQDQTIDQSEVATVLKRLKTLMDQDKIFVQQDLTLSSLAHEVPTSGHLLSRVINQHFNQSFSDYVNNYRIREFIRLAKTDKDSFLALAFQVGFSSKPTFNRAFKKIKGITPREYFKEK